ncbi:MAG: UDP-N-acetylmuramate--L-alanine ligase [Actinomycetes bacterium]
MTSDRLAELGRVHVIGIGGAGMSALGRLFAARGVPLTGSELRESRVLAPLRALGVPIHLEQTATSLGDVDTVVVSTAIPARNAELVAAHERGLRILHRAEALGYAMAGRTGVVVAGTHGKTTTTSMLAVALQHCQSDPSFYIGAQMNETGTNAHAGTGPIFLAEADESDGSFLVLDPDLAVVTNVEADHLDYYGTAEGVEVAFRAFVDRLAPGGTLVTCADDAGAVRLVEYAHSIGHEAVTFGQEESADLRIESLRFERSGTSFEAVLRGRRLGEVQLRVHGLHNALNAAAALATATTLGFPSGDVCEGLGLYTGARRRFEFKGSANGVSVFDDYAHHHTELRATLTAARQLVGDGRLVVAFQPLRFSRTAVFHRELGEALGLADDVVVMEVFGSNESPIPGATGALVAASVPLAAEHVHFEPSFSAVAAWLVDRARPGDIILTLGDGMVTMLGPDVVDLLRARTS